MPRSPKKADRHLGEEEPHVYHYSDLQRCTGKTNEAIRQHVSRGNLDLGKLESVVMWLARHAKPELRRKILQYALEPDVPNAPPKL